MDLPIYKIQINEKDESTGMKAMSIVDEGAIESDFLTFNNDHPESKQVVALQNEDGEYKQVIAGLALIPNKLIYRKNGDYEYFVYFEPDEVERIRNKFHREKLTDVINLQHDGEDIIEGYLIESYIINSEERLAEVKAQGIKEAVMGSWYVQYKIDDKDAFKRALEKEFNGFSIEIMGELIPNKLNNNKNKFNSMSKLNEIIAKFKEVLNSFEAMEANIAETDRKVVYNEGDVALEVVTDEDGTEKNEQLAAGEYILDNGYTIVVNEMGIVESVTEKAPDKVEDNEFETVAIEDGEQSVNYTEVGQPVYYVTEEGEQGDLVTDGDYPLADGRLMVIADGVLAEIKDAEEEVPADFSKEKEEFENQITNLKSEKTELETKVTNLETEKTDLETKVQELEAKVTELEKEPMTGPVKITEGKKLSKQDKKDIEKMSNLEYNLYKHGLK